MHPVFLRIVLHLPIILATMSKKLDTEGTVNELDWIRVRSELYEDCKVETFKERFIRKTSENPTIPIGAMATVAALTFGIWSFYKGNSRMSQYMMRARVAAQGFTILSIAVGCIVLSKK